MRISIGSDHAGYEYKKSIKLFVEARGHEVKDCGAYSNEPSDYPVFIRAAVMEVLEGRCDRAIVLGGSGNGEAIAANRHKGIRCALCWNTETARLAREHNDANALSIGQRMIDLETAIRIVAIWLETPFAGGRHEKRIRMLDED